MESGISSGGIAGISVAAIAGLLLFAGCFYVVYYRKRRVAKIELSPAAEDQSIQGSSHSSWFIMCILFIPLYYIMRLDTEEPTFFCQTYYIVEIATDFDTFYIST